jgi:hypothetical protein
VIEIIETYGKTLTGDFSAVTTGGRVKVEIIHQQAQYIAPEWRNPKCGCPVYLIREKTKAFTIPEQYRVVVRDNDGIVWEDRRRFLSYDKAVTAAVNKAKRGL